MADGRAEESVRETVSKMKLCSFYNQGRCRFGAQCRNFHPVQDSSQSEEKPVAGTESKDKKLLMDIVRGGEKASMDTVKGDEKPSMDTVRGDEKPSMDTVRGDEKPPMDTVRGDEKPPMDTVRGDEKPPMDTVRGDEKPPMDTVRGDEKPPMDTVRGDEKPPMDTVRGDEKPPMDTVRGDEKPPMDTVRGDEKPPMDTVRGDEKPPMDTVRGDEKPPMDTVRGDEKPPMDTVRGDEKPPMDTVRGDEKPPMDTVRGDEKPPMDTVRGDEKLSKDSTAGAAKLPNLTPGTKKARMRTAGEVVSRLRWDPELGGEEFTVGYLDRFVGLLEQPFEAFSWGDLSSAAPGELAIPQHRIQYFKHRGRVVWDKGRRIDDIFGSTGSGCTIHQLLGHGQDGGGLGGGQDGGGLGGGQDGGGLGDGQDGEGQMGGQDGGCQDRRGLECHQDGEGLEGNQDGRELGDSLDGEKQESIQDGCQLSTVKDGQLSDLVTGDSVSDVGSDAYDDGSYGNSDTCSLGRSHDNEAYSPVQNQGLALGPGPRANHFVAVRVSGEAFGAAAQEVQERLRRALPDFEPCLVPISRLHLTLCPLHLENPAQLEAARSALRQLAWEGRRLLPPALLLEFGELRDFGGRVLYTAPLGPSLLELGRLAAELRRRFRELGLCVLGGSGTPTGQPPLHVTLAKLGRSYCLKHPGVRLLPEIYRPWPQPQFGCQPLEELCLCATRGLGGSGGFYSTQLVVSLY